jgi:hypothetical protein
VSAATPPRDTANWAPAREVLEAPVGANAAQSKGVAGRRLAGPVQGFGRMWQKTYRVRLGTELAPETVIAHWRDHYGELWPASNRFIAPLAGVKPGEIGLIQGQVGGLTLSTGVLVLYSDDVSFAYLTPEGHPFAGIITFSAERDGDGTVAQVQLLIRAQDPLTEVAMAFGGHRKEDRIWEHTLTALAASLGIDGVPGKVVVCVDRRRQWKRFGNVRHDPALRALRHPRGGGRC